MNRSTVDDVIFWNAASRKWQDEGNNFFCSASHDGQGWEVRARYQFEDGTSLKRYPTEAEAMTFYKDVLRKRYCLEAA
ncbi:hypothetical protein HOU02_gp209 [Caulobacter phage CcrBL9]|uniref:Uncharacterized protein n=1 Tax=Caulobacter phage CcrBL9 TaxID=2283270 RepID=A0A385ECV7_9CAUD|nr:hypothetical protein HOU02_gp209 [Caulobacter phage CcrBL9]AXQ69516.1 hypothetical protein CcrBL9_gp492c [Caulobacter phage CcrBL9]